MVGRSNDRAGGDSEDGRGSSLLVMQKKAAAILNELATLMNGSYR